MQVQLGMTAQERTAIPDAALSFSPAGLLVLSRVTSIASMEHQDISNPGKVRAKPEGRDPREGRADDAHRIASEGDDEYVCADFPMKLSPKGALLSLRGTGSGAWEPGHVDALRDEWSQRECSPGISMHSLDEVKADKAQIAKLLTAARRNLADAQIESLSSENRFDANASRAPRRSTRM